VAGTNPAVVAVFARALTTFSHFRDRIGVSRMDGVFTTTLTRPGSLFLSSGGDASLPVNQLGRCGPPDSVMAPSQGVVLVDRRQPLTWRLRACE